MRVYGACQCRGPWSPFWSSRSNQFGLDWQLIMTEVTLWTHDVEWTRMLWQCVRFIQVGLSWFELGSSLAQLETSFGYFSDHREAISSVLINEVHIHGGVFRKRDRVLWLKLVQLQYIISPAGHWFIKLLPPVGTLVDQIATTSRETGLSNCYQQSGHWFIKASWLEHGTTAILRKARHCGCQHSTTSKERSVLSWSTSMVETNK